MSKVEVTGSIKYADHMDAQKVRLEAFTKQLNVEPDPKELETTPDGKAKYLPISYVEMTLDELFFGQWSTENFKWSAITNEVQGSLELVLIHPVTQKEIRRTGAASIVIMVDKAPDNITGQERNRWAMDPSNKKSNALDMAFPKLKAECIKNAAQSLGKRFGRDLNRKMVDTFKPQYVAIPDNALQAAVARVEAGQNADQVLLLCQQNFIMEDWQIELIRNATNKQIAQ